MDHDATHLLRGTSSPASLPPRRHPVLTAAPHQVCVFLLSMPVKAAPTQALAAACFILAGVPVYYLALRGAPSPCAAAVGARLPCVCVVCVWRG